LRSLYHSAKHNNIISSNVYNNDKDPISSVPTNAFQLDSDMTVRSVANINNMMGARGKDFHDLRLWNMSKGTLSTHQIDEVNRAAKASYDNINDAAISILTAVNPISIDQNLEWGGLLYEWNNKVHSTLPTQGTENSVITESGMEQLPRGAILVGNWHTHGDWTDIKNNPVKNSAKDIYNSDNFSNQDVISFNSFRDNISDEFRYGYLGTPNGEFKKFDLNSQKSEDI